MSADVTARNTLVIPIRARSRTRRLWSLLRANPTLAVSLVILLLITTAAVFAPFVTTHDPDQQSLAESLTGPSSDHWAGTDKGGRDVWSRTVYAGRVSLLVGFGAMIVGGLLATLLGGLAGYIGGIVDATIQRCVDAALAIPALLILMTVLSVVGASKTSLVVVIGTWSSFSSARTVRSAVLSMKARQFVEAAQALGAGQLHIFFHHILPNIIAPVIIVSTLVFSYAILTEAALSFLGFGIPPPTATWGGMLAGDTRSLMVKAPWIGVAPGVALSIVVIAVNLAGDGLRDALDPRLRIR